MTEAPTFTATIWVGFRHGYSDHIDSIDTVYKVCQETCDAGWCVTVTPTEYIYTNGHEPGAAIGIINYPRFPTTAAALETLTLNLAEELRVALNQFRVSVVFSDRTVMLENPE